MHEQQLSVRNWSRGDGQEADVVDWRGLRVKLPEAWRLVNQLAVTRPRYVGELFHDWFELGVEITLVRRCRGQQTRRNNLLEVTVSNSRKRVAERDNLALLGKSN